ncbi:MAG: hypothetical protein IKP67_02610 [Spirochaetales bacterium]|jgi:Ni/Fe-hydrogenase subunit HybB-like protein|nr:hypothetical protein [Spirochaetales bacterium]
MKRKTAIIMMSTVCAVMLCSCRTMQLNQDGKVLGKGVPFINFGLGYHFSAGVRYNPGERQVRQ